jgi:alkylation response protein AidB-like acyl-CoA dehydrogenase
MDSEVRQAITVTLKRFTAHVDETLMTGEGPDGELAVIPRLLDEARELDLVTESTPKDPGYEYGVWGQLCHAEGLELSLLTLSALGEACAGFAMAVHAQGLGCLAAGGEVHYPPGTSLAAALWPDYGLPLGSLERSAGSGLQLLDGGADLLLTGSSHFFFAADEPERLICFVQATQAEWATVELGTKQAGVRLAEVSNRTGLRAARQYHLNCDQVAISPDQVLRTGDEAQRVLEQVLACDWLGQAAIALGISQRSLRDSHTYTAQRYQGGGLIKEHASIRLLQGTAAYDIGLLAAVLFQHANVPLSMLKSRDLLPWAIKARLAVVEHAYRAVTDCLQTLGGYGYMEDYGLEKRLRDVSTLKSMHGTPDQLKLLLNHVEERS